MKVKAGDMVEVISGNDRGFVGRVRVALPKENRVIVEGINIIRKHQRPMPTGGRRGVTEGGIIELEAPIDVSNVMIVCPSCDQRTRVSYRFLENGDKVRVCKECGAPLD
jgi:large subunit ribosomal protein L24